MAVVRNLLVRAGADFSELQKEMVKAQKFMKTASKDIGKIGKTLALGITVPLAGVGAAGVKLASGKSLEETIASMDMVVEGARTALAVNELVDELKIDAPIIKAVYKVIYLKMPVKDAVNELLMRSFKEE